MKATPKANECIKMIKEIEFVGYQFSIIKTDFYTKLLDENSDEVTKQIAREQFEGFVYWIDYYSALLHYRLLPIILLKWKNQNSFKHITDETEKEEFLSSISKHSRTKSSILWQVLTSHDEVTLDDLKNEFWEMIPNLDSIEEYYQIMKMKYSEVFNEIPDPSYFKYSDLINDATFMAYFNNLIKYGVTNRNEVEILILKLDRVVEQLNKVCSEILEMYKSFLPDSSKETSKYTGITSKYSEMNNVNQSNLIQTEVKTINKDELGKYFKPQFKGMGIHFNYLDTFIESLKVPRNAKSYAQIALMCYEGRQMNDQKPNSFAKWYEVFSEIIGCEKKTYDNKNKLRETIPDNLKNSFYFLE